MICLILKWWSDVWFLVNCIAITTSKLYLLNHLYLFGMAIFLNHYFSWLKINNIKIYNLAIILILLMLEFCYKLLHYFQTLKICPLHLLCRRNSPMLTSSWLSHSILLRLILSISTLILICSLTHHFCLTNRSTRPSLKIALQTLLFSLNLLLFPIQEDRVTL